jgi:cobaltochelatase CobS
MTANENGQTCTICKQPIVIGEQISWNRRGETGRYHTACKANPANPAGSDDVLGAVLARTIEPYLTITRDEITEELDARMDEKIASAIAEMPKEIKTVYIQSGTTIGTIDGHKHEHFDTLVKLINMRDPKTGHRKNVYAWGEAGSGKSTAALKVAGLLNLPFYYIALQAQLNGSAIMGYMDGHGNYRETDFYRAYKYGGIFLLDELELGSDNMLASLNGALANGHAAFPCGRVERHPDFICIATGNTPGLGATVMYSARRALDGSTRDRFAFLEWNTDETLEYQLASQYFTRSDAWVKWVRNVRSLQAEFPKLTATQRASVEGSQLLANGFTALESAHMWVFRGTDKVAVNSILARFPLPTF